jgi:mycothiol synthase
MNDFSCTIRNYRPGDFNNYVRLHIEAEQVDRSGIHITSKTLAECLGYPKCIPEKELFVAEKNGKIIGYMNVTPEPGIGRALLACLVHPRHRRKGLAKKLFPYAIERAKELGARVVQGSIPENNVVAKELVTRMGFRFARRFLELKLDFYNIQLSDTKGGNIVSRGLRSGEEDMLTEIQNRSFVGTWGFNPNTTEEIIYRVNLRGRSPEDVIMAYEGGKLIGYCWTTVSPPGNTARAVNKGQIHMLGMDPDYRKKGIGKEILMKGLHHLKGKGIEIVELTVDSENQAALSLYESVGFEIFSATRWYEKVLT